MVDRRNVVRSAAIVSMLGAFSSLVACSSEAASVYPDAERQWRAAGVQDYTITYVVEAGINGRSTLVTTVVDGKVDEHEGAGRLDLFDARTVEDMFDEINDAEQSTIVFSSEFGYPREAFLDVDEDAIDDEYGWQVIEFEPNALP